jgi:integrase
VPVVKLTVTEVQQRVDHVRLWNECPIKLKGNEPKDVFLYDTELPGFGCKVTKGGKASWFVEKRFGNQKNIRKKLGNYPRLGIEDARRHGQIILGQIANGVDVSKDRRESLVGQQETLNAKTLAACYAEYFVNLDDGSRFRREQRQAFEKWIAPVLGNLPPFQISKADIRMLLAGLSKSPQLACYKLLSPFFKHLAYNDVIQANPMSAILRPKPHKERKRAMSEREIRLYWSAAERLGYPQGSFFKFALLTGQRKSETTLAEWQHIDFDARTWFIPEENTTNGEAHIVHLSEQALEVLRQCPRHSRFIFSTYGPDPVAIGTDPWALLLALMSHPEASVRQVRDMAGNYAALKKLSTISPRLTLHDARKTCGSYMVNSLGVAPHVAHRNMNHALATALDRSYLRYDLLPERKAALEAWGAYVAKLVSGSM